MKGVKPKIHQSKVAVKKKKSSVVRCTRKSNNKENLESKSCSPVNGSLIEKTSNFSNLKRELNNISIVQRAMISPISDQNLFTMNEKAEKYLQKLKKHLQNISWEELNDQFILP